MGKKLIHSDPEIMGGTPVFKGTRVPVQTLFDWLETETLDDFLDNFPSISRKHAISVLRQAKKSVIQKKFLDETSVG